MAVNAQDIHRLAYEQAYWIENKLVDDFTKAINESIRAQVSHGINTVSFAVPPYHMGYPCYDAGYIARKLREKFTQAGFTVNGTGLTCMLVWSPQN
jgi:hypothetical protein